MRRLWSRETRARYASDQGSQTSRGAGEGRAVDVGETREAGPRVPAVSVELQDRRAYARPPTLFKAGWRAPALTLS